MHFQPTNSIYMIRVSKATESYLSEMFFGYGGTFEETGKCLVGSLQHLVRYDLPSWHLLAQNWELHQNSIPLRMHKIY